MDLDTINGTFELVGAFLTWKNAYELYKSKELKGCYWPTTLFFTLWGFWNLIYYSSLGQWFSFTAGIFLGIGNALWVGQAIWYLYFKKEPQKESKHIFINGEKYEWNNDLITYWDIISIANLEGYAYYSVMYQNGPEKQREGIISYNSFSKDCCDGMKFTVVDTGNA